MSQIELKISFTPDVSQVNTFLTELKKSLGTLGASIKPIDESVFQKAMKSAEQSVQSSSEKMRQSLSSASDAMASASKKSAEATASAWTNSLARVLKFNELTQAVQNITGSMREIGDSFVSLDKASAEMRALGKEATALSAPIREAALTMSRDIPFGAAQLQKAMTNALASGIKPLDAAGSGLRMFAENTARLAAAAGADLEQTNSAVAGFLNAFGKDARATAEFADIMYDTVNAGVVSVQQIAQYGAGAASTAASASLQFKDVGKAIAVLTQNGQQAPEAFTNLNNLFVKLLKPTESMTQAFSLAGVSIDSLKTGTLEERLATLQGVMKKTGVDAISLVGDIQAGTALSTLTKNMESTRDIFGQVGEKAGSTQYAYEQMSQSVDFQTKQMQARFDEFKVRMLDGLGSVGIGAMGLVNGLGAIAPQLTALAAIKNVLPQDVFSSALSSVKGFATNSASAMRSFAVSSAGYIADAFRSPGDVMKSAKTIVFDYAKALGSQLVSAAQAAKLAITGMGVASKVAMGGVLGVVGVLTTLYFTFEPFKNFVDGVLAVAVEKFKQMADWVGKVAGSIGALLGLTKKSEAQIKSNADASVASIEKTGGAIQTEAESQEKILQSARNSVAMLREQFNKAKQATGGNAEAAKQATEDFAKQAETMAKKITDTALRAKMLAQIDEIIGKKQKKDTTAAEDATAKRKKDELDTALALLAVESKRVEQDERAKRLAENRTDLTTDEQLLREDRKVQALQMQIDKYKAIYNISNTINRDGDAVLVINTTLSKDKTKDAELKNDVVEKVRSLQVALKDANNDRVELGVKFDKAEFEQVKKDLLEVNKTFVSIQAEQKKQFDATFADAGSALSAVLGSTGAGLATSAKFAVETALKFSDEARNARKIAADKELADLGEKFKNENLALKAAKDADLITENVFLTKKKALQDKFNQDEENIKEKSTEYSLALAADALGAFKGVFAEQTAAYKAMAITEASIATYLAATKALTAGPVLGPILAAITVAAGLANVAKIAGFRKGGYTGDGGADDTAGIVHKGEFVFNKDMTARNRAHFEKMHKERLSMDEYAEKYLKLSQYGVVHINNANRTDTRGIEQRLDTMIARLDRVESAQVRTAKRFESLSKVEVKNDIVIKDKRRTLL